MAVRAVNASGTATTGIVVDGVSLGDAAAGYTSISSAVAASSNGDTIVITDANEYNPGSITTGLTNLTITCDDTVRWSGGAYDATAARLLLTFYLFTVSAGGSVLIKNLSIKKTSAGALVTGGAGASLTIRRCAFIHAGAGSSMVYDGVAGTTITADNCFVELSVQGGNTRVFLGNSSDYALSVFNCTIVYTSSAGTSASLVQGGSAVKRIGCANVKALRTNAASVPVACYWSATAHPSYTAGNNMSSKTDAPGTTAYQSVLADSILADVATLDMRWKDRATAELYPGVDVSADVPDYDAEFQARGDEWFVGADWIAATVAAVAASSVGFFLMCPFGLLYGLQDE